MPCGARSWPSPWWSASDLRARRTHHHHRSRGHLRRPRRRTGHPGRVPPWSRPPFPPGRPPTLLAPSPHQGTSLVSRKTLLRCRSVGPCRTAPRASIRTRSCGSPEPAPVHCTSSRRSRPLDEQSPESLPVAPDRPSWTCPRQAAGGSTSAGPTSTTRCSSGTTAHPPSARRPRIETGAFHRRGEHITRRRAARRPVTETLRGRGLRDTPALARPLIYRVPGGGSSIHRSDAAPLSGTAQQMRTSAAPGDGVPCLELPHYVCGH